MLSETRKYWDLAGSEWRYEGEAAAAPERMFCCPQLAGCRAGVGRWEPRSEPRLAADTFCSWRDCDARLPAAHTHAMCGTRLGQGPRDPQPLLP